MKSSGRVWNKIKKKIPKCEKVEKFQIGSFRFWVGFDFCEGFFGLVRNLWELEVKKTRVGLVDIWWPWREWRVSACANVNAVVKWALWVFDGDLTFLWFHYFISAFAFHVVFYFYFLFFLFFYFGMWHYCGISYRLTRLGGLPRIWWFFCFFRFWFFDVGSLLNRNSKCFSPVIKIKT